MDTSLINQKKFLATKLEKFFPSYQISPRQNTKKIVIKPFKVPEIDLSPASVKNTFKFKTEELQKSSKKNYTVARLKFRPKTNSFSETFGLMSLLRGSSREKKDIKIEKLEIKLSKFNKG
jgi:hypothetical protein